MALGNEQSVEGNTQVHVLLSREVRWCGLEKLWWVLCGSKTWGSGFYSQQGWFTLSTKACHERFFLL